MEVFPCSKNILILLGARFEYYDQLSKLGRHQNLNRTHSINSGIELNLNFKGFQTLWEKSGKFTNILSQHDLHKSEFSWAHLYAKNWSSNTSVKMN
jgi:hypothetical protein